MDKVFTLKEHTSKMIDLNKVIIQWACIVRNGGELNEGKEQGSVTGHVTQEPAEAGVRETLSAHPGQNMGCSQRSPAPSFQNLCGCGSHGCARHAISTCFLCVDLE